MYRDLFPRGGKDISEPRYPTTEPICGTSAINTDNSEFLRSTVLDALADSRALCIVGSGSKSFYGRLTSGAPLVVTGHRGMINYQPTELVLTARAGTPLVEIEAQLATHGQMLPFEPPHFGPDATLGGTIACGLSGPRRPYAGAARDVVLGVSVLTGKGEILKFGGQVMKNVAGFDVSRLMVGALGTLGVLLDISLKVLPRAEAEETLSFEYPPALAIEQMNRWAGLSLPLSAAAYDGEKIYLRLAGSATGLRAAHAQLGGESLLKSESFWQRLREQQHGFFQGDSPLWRLSLPPATPPLDIEGRWFIDWGGAQRWLHSDVSAVTIRELTARHGGHATLFQGADREGEVFHPLSAGLFAIHQRLKAAFDPQGILNPGRLYAGL